jgi:hypothetical protein
MHPDIMAMFLYSLTGDRLAILAIGRLEQFAWRFFRLIGTIILAAGCGEHRLVAARTFA